jgi:hypothetical protein
MVIDFDYRPGAVHIDMCYYVINCLDAYNVQGVSLTPATPNLFNISLGSPPLDGPAKEKFHSCVARLLF